MDKRILAFVLAMLVAVPAAICMVQSDSDAQAGSRYEGPVTLGNITVNVGETKTVDIRNNEAAYSNYHSYTMKFELETSSGTWAELATFGKDTDTSGSAQSTGDVTVSVSRQADHNHDGYFQLSIKGDSVTSDDVDVYVRCTVTVTPDTSSSDQVITDEIFYKICVKVIGADGTIDFGVSSTSFEIVSGQSVNLSIPVTTPTLASGMYVFAYGLPTGLNINIVPTGESYALSIAGMTTSVSQNDTADTVYVVIRDSDGVEYGGTISILVKDAASTAITVEITDATAVTDDSYYVIDGTESVNLKITGTEQAFGGAVYVLDNSSGSYTREPVSGTTDDLVTEYTIPVGGVGQYVIEVLNVDGTQMSVVLNVVPQSTGAGASLIIVGQ